MTKGRTSAATPKAPAHLSKEAAAWWRLVVRDYDLEPHHLHLLQAACEAWDRMQQARETVGKEGIVFRAANGDLKTNPAVTIEKDARIAFARLVRGWGACGRRCGDWSGSGGNAGT